MMNDPNSFSAMAGLPQNNHPMGGQSLMAMGMGMGGSLPVPPPMNNLAVDNNNTFLGGGGGPPMYGSHHDGSAGMGGGYRGRGRGRGRGMSGGGSHGGYGGDMGGYGGMGNGLMSHPGAPMTGGHVNPMDPSDMRNRCTFFQKMGACRHGDSCTKFHIRPTSGQTVLFPKMYPNPQAVQYLRDREWGFEFEERYLKKYFHNFYKTVWRSFMKIARIVELRVVANLCEHLVGNVYVKFADPEKAAYVCENLRHRLHLGILLLPEMTPVNDFSEACCKEDRESAMGCKRKLDCNFLHLMKVSRDVMEKLVKEQDEYWDAHEKAQKEKEAAREKERAERQKSSSLKEKDESTRRDRDKSDRKDKDRDDKDREKEKGSSSNHRDKSDRDREHRRDRSRDRDGKEKRSSSARKDDRKDDKDRHRSDRDRRDKHDKVDKRRDRSRSRRDKSDRDRDRERRDRRDSRDRGRSRSRDRDRDRRKRDRSPAGDERLCMVCGKKGHISKDCSHKV